MIHKTIEIIYTCGTCSVTDCKVNVAVRGEHQDLGDWMEKMTLRLMQDHAARSPGCMAREFKQVKVPLGNSPTAGIGHEVIRDPQKQN